MESLYLEVNPNRQIEEIISENRHQFLYGANGINRTEFLKSLTGQFPIITSANIPMAIYVSDRGLKNIDEENKSLDRNLVKEFHSQYFATLFSYHLMDNIVGIEKALSEEMIVSFLKRIVPLLDTFESITSLEVLKLLLKQSTEALKYEAELYFATGIKRMPDVPIYDVSLHEFMKESKKMLQNESYYCLFFDQQHPLPFYSRMAINNYISRRCNAYLSMKIACEDRDWMYYSDGDVIQRSNDYGELNIDACISYQLKRE